MTLRPRRIAAAIGLALLTVPLFAAEVLVDLSKERVGRPPTTFEPMVGSWVIAEDGGEKVVMVDGRPWVSSKDNPTRLLVESARRLYGTTNEELMDNAKQFAYYPVAVLRGLDNFSGRLHRREVQDDCRRVGSLFGDSVQREAERRLAGHSIQRHGEQHCALGIPRRPENR